MAEILLGAWIVTAPEDYAVLCAAKVPVDPNML